MSEDEKQPSFEDVQKSRAKKIDEMENSIVNTIIDITSEIENIDKTKRWDPASAIASCLEGQKLMKRLLRKLERMQSL
jgi:hypothetical protein